MPITIKKLFNKVSSFKFSIEGGSASGGQVSRYSLFILMPILWLLFLGYWVLPPMAANASVLFFHPQQEVIIEEGESVIVEAFLDTKGEEINVVDATLKFPPDLVEVRDVSRGQSVLTLWISDPVIDNTAGMVQFTGGIPTGGEFPAGALVRITLYAKTTGNGVLRWDAASRVLLNDGRGTLDMVETLDTPLTITPALTDVPRISSITHNNQSTWYQGTTLFVSWQLAPHAVYSYTFDHDPREIPDEIPDKPEGELRFDGSLKYKGLDDGIYYFHLRQGIPENGDIVWSQTRTFRAQIDTTPPDTLLGEIGFDPTVYDGKFFVSFSGTDTLSGIDYYKVREGAVGNWVRAVSPYELSDQRGAAPVHVRVFDKAGSMKEIVVEFPAKPARFAIWHLVFISLVIIAIVLGARKYYKKLQKTDK